MTDDGKAAQQVRDWLKTQGYPLEYEAARILRSAGFRTIQGWSYRDEDESGLIKAREIDVHATLRGKVGSLFDEGATDAAQFTVVVEAKYMTAPWVVLTTEHPAAWTPLATPLMLHEMEKVSTSPQALLPLPDRVGFWVKTAAKGQDTAREALMQATNAAASAVDGGDGWKPPEWALPAVLVRDSLFTLGYTLRGTEILEEVPWCRLVWHGADAFPSPTLVDVVTRRHWRAYTKALRATIAPVLRAIDERRAKEQAIERAKRERLVAEMQAKKAARGG